jgi:hypothetical protein
MVIIKDLYWKYYTRPARGGLTGVQPGTAIPQVDFSGAAGTIEEAAERAAQHAAGLHQQTLQAGYTLMEEEIAAILLSGRAFHGVNFIITPSLYGAVLGTDTKGVKKSFVCTLTKPFAQQLKNVKLMLKGQKDFEAFASITSVENVFTHTTDNTITIGDDIFISGDKIKVLGNPQTDPKAIEAGIGVFFVPETGNPIHAPRLNQNEPSFINVRVPNTLQNNKTYTLRIVTRYSNGTALLVEPRHVEYHTKLTAVE